MKLRRFADPEAFLKAGRAHLLAEEARTGLLHGIVQQLARGAHRREEAYLALLEDGGEVVGAAVRTPPWKLVLGPMSDAGIEKVVADLLEADPTLPEAMAPASTFAPFLARWTAATGARATAGMAQKLYRLDAVTPTEAPGRMRHPRDAERGLLVEWANGFHRDIGLRLHGSLDTIIDAHLREQTLRVWEDESGAPVSMAVGAQRGPTSARIAFVYTPPEQRRRGYAGALVAAIAEEQLAKGRSFVTLFTERENPTSNHIYQQVGFRFVEDFEEARFSYG
ncbi:MAG TPA: GNAT family N-acetyltransferase [Polyangiaceae bacterium LLY-WYZ-15_(1-7)]|nr:GNAT family N-acetyltransferase [Polyangiaceae bacterium LLY-WYZ-15_(1-7)]HJL06481.1 GNAT family N-acetyltransferase [Polyangiaceae bacterium LLY-WYZ-15_(1-7)]HJL12351.1 GNAT family N-acetyltransferase [Polyangiaceae bacterium LLY-WYZ-15_(1-7)]HJL24112.1 GNAT family N-acetyltransferase [Polyangiaceae bacterium LLY-WYZ-15_(1-7)]HJL36435.1 GNAT family N-acetyltransferase [Polyangiaceae bacterium LLY-WYZ-15_(1-7)]